MAPAATALAAEVVARLAGTGTTVATAESLTGGLLGAAITTVPGASAVYRGGVVAYASDVKAALLGVDAELLAADGPVSPGVARQMASGAARLLGASYGVATTGVAGPQPQGGRPAGTVYVAVAGPTHGGASTGVGRPLSFRGNREEVRRATVVAALDALRDLLAAAALPAAGTAADVAGPQREGHV